MLAIVYVDLQTRTLLASSEYAKGEKNHLQEYGGRRREGENDGLLKGGGWIRVWGER